MQGGREQDGSVNLFLTKVFYPFLLNSSDSTTQLQIDHSWVTGILFSLQTSSLEDKWEWTQAISFIKVSSTVHTLLRIHENLLDYTSYVGEK